MSHDVSQVDERRRFFRIDDEINLFYKQIDPGSIQVGAEMAGELLNNCSLAAALDILGQESQIIFNRIERSTPDIAEYLKIMDSKISLLARTMLMDGNDLVEQRPHTVSLSASGIAFDCAQQFSEGDYLEVRILLTSCMAVIVSYGKVIYCRKNELENDEFPYVIGIEYTQIKEQDRELLIKHVVKRQMQQVREQKGSQLRVK
jgi:hypothetical protein